MSHNKFNIIWIPSIVMKIVFAAAVFFYRVITVTLQNPPIDWKGLLFVQLGGYTLHCVIVIYIYTLL